MNNTFEIAYQKLNSEQKKAVDTIYWPVVVIAWPWTGKTQLLTLRIAQILNMTDMNPSNILALSYTEAGAFAMRERLSQFIGSLALKVNISTFHWFCKRLIDEEFAEKFARSPNMKMLEELDSRRMIADILINGSYQHITPRHDPELFMGDVIRIIGQLKREWVTPENFRNTINQTINELPMNEDLHYKRDCKWWKKWEKKADYFDTLERLKKQNEVSYVYDEYEKLLLKQSRYDYDDMIIMVRDTLRIDPQLLRMVQEQYQYIMVDEFQDTNSLQTSIVDIIMQWQDQPNILVVGDDEQSIYRFQGAVMENIINFCDKYRDFWLTIIPLIENYRSTQTILSASREVIRHNTESLEKSLDLSKELSKNALYEEKKIQIMIADDPQIEIGNIIQVIQDLKKSWLDYSDIAIIYRKNSHPIHLIEYLRREKIPFHKQKWENLLHHPEAQKLLKTLKIIYNSYQNDLFWEVMLFDFWELDLHYLLSLQGKLRASNGEYRRTLFQAFLDETDIFVRSVVEKICQLQSDAANKTLVQFFESFLEISGYREFTLKQPDMIERFSILNSFFDEIKSFSDLHPDHNLKQFIEYLGDLDHYGLSPTTQPIKMQPDTVELMTAHGSKWLEFRAVIIYNATSKNWESSRDPSKITITVSLFDSHVIDSDMKKQQKLEEERRLWYVAMTRAKESLIISATKNQDMGLQPSLFITEIPEIQKEEKTPLLNTEHIVIAQTQIVPKQNWSEATRIEIEKRAKNYVLSVTGLNAWLRSPLEFYEKYLIRQPAGKMPSASFGTAVHAGLAFIGKHVNEHGTLPQRDLWLDTIRDTLTAEILTLQEQHDFLIKTTEIIDNYLSKKECPLLQKWLIEVRFWWKNVTIHGVKLTGVFDRIEKLPDGTMQVIDFKTGKSDKSSEQILEYKRQLYFYRLLWDGSNMWESLSQGAIDFVEWNTEWERVNRRIFVYENDGIEELKHDIARFRESLETLDFPREHTLL